MNDRGLASGTDAARGIVDGNPSGYPGTFGLTLGKVESDSRYFPIPGFCANWKLGDDGAFGLTLREVRRTAIDAR